jgi:diguanylate cyclase (GGDEF)-like protein/PAS domain S-box-containing protein
MTAAPMTPAAGASHVPSEQLLARALEISPQPVLLASMEHGRNGDHPPDAVARGDVAVVWANQAALHILGGQPGDAAVLDGITWQQSGHSAGPADPLVALLQRGGGHQDLGLRRADGSSVHVRVHAFHLDHPAPVWVIQLEELTEVRRATEELRASEARFRTLADHAPIGIFASEAGLRLGFVNQRAAELLDRDQTELLSTGWQDVIDPRDLHAVIEGLAGTLEGRSVDLSIRTASSKRWLRLRAGPVQLPGQGGGFIGSLEDVTTDRVHQDALTHQATHDALTGLPNRVALHNEIEETLRRRRTGDGSLALLFFDLDHFKIVNDSLGHAVGDRLLIEVTDRLLGRARDGDLLARFGGDEFVLLCPQLHSPAVATRIAERMIEALEAPIILEGRSFQVSASVGIVVADSERASAETLLRDADIAMYEAKAAGRARTSVFDAASRARADHRLRVVTDLRRALRDDELVLAYQPIVALGARAGEARMVGAEALLRWRHPVHGSLAIPELIDLAEETGLMPDLGAWVLRRACTDLAAWRRSDPSVPAWLSINVSATQLSDEGFPRVVEEVTSAHGLTPADLCLELTEHVLVSPEDTPMRVLRSLRAQGSLIALDDFGTGYSSLAYLKDMPVDVVKVAAPFVAGLCSDPRDAAIVEAVVRMAQAIGVDVIAEGVETAEQRAALARLGCPKVQGYLLGRPGRADALLGWTDPAVST